MLRFWVRLAIWLLSIAGTCSAAAYAADNVPVCNVLDYGAHRDGSARSTAAIRRAIQSCSSGGGGTVFFPVGVYESGAIELVSNLAIRLDAGAILRFHTDLSEYPIVASRSEGIEALTPAPLIGGRGLHNVTISGRGVLTTSNAEWRARMNNAAAQAAWEAIQQRLERKQQVTEVEFRQAAPAIAPSFIRFMECTNVLIEDVHIEGSPMWTIHLLYSEHVVVRNVTVETYPGSNTDGIDVDSSRDVRISDSYFDTGDDGICLKSGRDADGRRVGRPTENVAITNCTFHRGHGAIVIGSETAGGVRNVVASNIICNGTEHGIRIKSGRARGGVVENIRFNNWVIQNTVSEAIIITSYYTMIPVEPISERTPIFRDIALSNITVSGSPVVARIEGLPEMPISGLQISDLIGSGNRGLRAFNVSGLALRAVRINARQGPEFLIRDAEHLELDRIDSTHPGTAPIVRLDNCSDTVIRASRAWPGTDIFLSIQPGNTKSIFLYDNHLAGARLPTVEADTDYWQGVASPDRGVRKDRVEKHAK